MENPTALHILIHNEDGHAEIEDNELVLYKAYPDKTFTEVWRGGLYKALRELAIEAWFD